jgi:hypothetical protein
MLVSRRRLIWAGAAFASRAPGNSFDGLLVAAANRADASRRFRSATMPRPFEPFADALRTARDIVRERGGAVAQAAVQADSRAYDEACNALVVRIAQAIVDAGEAATTHRQSRDHEAA